MRWPCCGNVINSQGHTRSHFSRMVKGMSTLFLRIVQWSSKVVSCESIPAGPVHEQLHQEMQHTYQQIVPCIWWDEEGCLVEWVLHVLYGKVPTPLDFKMSSQKCQICSTDRVALFQDWSFSKDIHVRVLFSSPGVISMLEKHGLRNPTFNP